MTKAIIKFTLFNLLFLGSVLRASSQVEMPEDKVHWKFRVEQNGDEATIIGEISMEEHWHIYAANLPEGGFLIPTEIKLNPSKDFKTIGKVIEPKPEYVHDDLTDEDLYYHSGKVVLKRKIKVLSENDFDLKGVFSFQTCDDTHCLPPFDAEFKVRIKGVQSDETQSNENVEDVFIENEEGIAKDKDGRSYVQVEGKWYKVPEGNSAAFYKKYLMLGGKHEE